MSSRSRIPANDTKLEIGLVTQCAGEMVTIDIQEWENGIKER